MRRVAAIRVYINGKEFHHHVVELLEHLVVNHYPLKGEQPMTEWLGGTIIVSGREAYHSRQVLSADTVSVLSLHLLSPSELGTDDSCGNGHIERL